MKKCCACYQEPQLDGPFNQFNAPHSSPWPYSDTSRNTGYADYDVPLRTQNMIETSDPHVYDVPNYPSTHRRQNLSTQISII